MHTLQVNQTESLMFKSLKDCTGTTERVLWICMSIPPPILDFLSLQKIVKAGIVTNF